MFIIPAIDLIDGKVVRLKGGNYSEKTEYSANPLDMTLRFEEAGLTHLHLVDLDGAKSDGPKNLKVLETIASKTKLSVDFGGGIKTREHLESALSSGAKEVSLGSIAVKKREEVMSWVSCYKDRIILSADAKNELIAISGWQEETGISLFEFIKSYRAKGVDKVITTDIARDGMLTGPAIDLYKKILSKEPGLKLIASGGVSSKEDLAALKDAKLYGAIVGKAYYEGRITLKELKEADDAC